jgi:hypothetical protein
MGKKTRLESFVLSGAIIRFKPVHRQQINIEFMLLDASLGGPSF